MYHSANDFSESINYTVILEIEASGYYMHNFNSPDPDDEEDDDNDDEGDSENSGTEEGEPQIDSDVVHSPVPPSTGGRPK